MIVVRVELWSAVTGSKTELGRMHIANDGTGTDTFCHYDGAVMRKPDFKVVTREGRVESHARHRHVVWVLVRKMLQNMGY